MIEHNGVQYARVTEILSSFVSFSHINLDVLENKCRIGTNVHQAIADDVNESFPCLASDEIGYFESFLKWKEFFNPFFKLIEQRLYCDKKKITGQIDALVCSEGKKTPLLVDFKTSAQESPITWPMQAHLYYHLLKENNISTENKFLFIKLDKSGKMPKVFNYSYDPNINAKCMKAIDSYWEMKK